MYDGPKLGPLFLLFTLSQNQEAKCECRWGEVCVGRQLGVLKLGLLCDGLLRCAGVRRLHKAGKFVLAFGLIHLDKGHSGTRQGHSLR